MAKVLVLNGSPKASGCTATALNEIIVTLEKEGIDESYPPQLPTHEIAEYISRKKAAAYRRDMASGELIITADTIVVLDNEVMGKPHDEADASRMLHELSGRGHQVITGVTLTTTTRQKSFSVETDVTFKTAGAGGAALAHRQLAHRVPAYLGAGHVSAFCLSHHGGISGFQGAARHGGRLPHGTRL